MKYSILILFIPVFILSCNIINAQGTIGKTTPLFYNQEPFDIKLKMSIKEVKKNTNDSTFLKNMLYYKNKTTEYDSLKIDIRARGKNRLANCHYIPLKLKLQKSTTKETPFEGNKKLKLVLPCLFESNNNDYIIKEYMAYKLYEIVTPIHYKTRMVNIEFIEEKGRHVITHALKGILIEDVDNVAKRLNANEIKIRILPLQHDNLASIRNSFFQYLIGNTDFSTKYQHNAKLLFIDKKIIPLPYDFDMSGLVDASYAIVSDIPNRTLDITNVKERVYLGIKRDELHFEQVRNEFIENKAKMYNLIDSLEKYFEDRNQFIRAKIFVTGFFEIIEDDKKFERNILNKARVD